ncbi:MAG: lipase, partial [Oscillospiraceae bacterium]
MEESYIENTNYPFVFVHGMYGYGEDVKINKFLPYWGMYTGSLVEYLNEQGFECYAPSVGPFSSAWDRACELYAQIFGGTVDYGVAHAKEHGHNRFGRTYDTPLIKDIGKRNDDGSFKKINLVGHSFGGETIR